MSATPILLSPALKRILAIITEQSLRAADGAPIPVSAFKAGSPKITEASLTALMNALAERTFTDARGEYFPILSSWHIKQSILTCVLSREYVTHLSQFGCLPLGWLNGPILKKPKESA